MTVAKKKCSCNKLADLITEAVIKGVTTPGFYDEDDFLASLGEFIAEEGGNPDDDFIVDWIVDYLSENSFTDNVARYLIENIKYETTVTFKE